MTFWEISLIEANLCSQVYIFSMPLIKLKNYRLYKIIYHMLLMKVKYIVMHAYQINPSDAVPLIPISMICHALFKLNYLLNQAILT